MNLPYPSTFIYKTALSNYLNDLIDQCSPQQCRYHEQSLVILKHCYKCNPPSSLASRKSGSLIDSKLGLNEYFHKCLVQQMSVIERPKEEYQVYMAKHLSKYFHFSCPTNKIVQLFFAMKGYNNKSLKLLFIPRSCVLYKSPELCVSNQSMNEFNLLQEEREFDKMLRIIDERGITSKSSTSSKSSTKRTAKAISIGMQTMYSHQQHKSRYCMLPHSAPFVPTVKKHNIQLMRNILAAYQFSSSVTSSSFHHMIHGGHAFSLIGHSRLSENERHFRMKQRSEMFSIMFGDILRERDDMDESHFDKIFEACTMQETGMLRFHRDLMNCPTIDNTVAVHVPSMYDFGRRCISFMFYTRKCVGDYSQKMATMENYLLDKENSCGLTVLCLKSILEVKGIFNYQGSLFENPKSFKKIANGLLLSEGVYNCPEVTRFTGLKSVKYGAAFDKMGYYSIYLNVFLSMHYLGLVQTVDDAISLCIYFGLLCNGTSNLAATWKDLSHNLDFVRDSLEA